MRWYDYLMCLWLADILSTSIVYGYPFVLLASLLSYKLYENMRIKQTQ